MNIEELKEAKQVLQQRMSDQITQMASDFTKATGVQIKDISFGRHADSIGEPPYFAAAVIELNLGP